MNYLSLNFIFLIIVAIPLYYLMGKKRQLWVLALANLIFYASAGIKYLPFILLTIFFTYIAGRQIGSIYEKSECEIEKCTTNEEKKQIKEISKKSAKRVLIITILLVIMAFVVCKYTNFIFDNIINIFNINTNITFKLILPLGISFYTFMALSYILDVYWKKYKAEKNFLMYAVYLSYFPHVIQGPIDRFNKFKEQVKDGIKFNYKSIVYGLELCLWGLFKKLVIADKLGIFVDNVFSLWNDCSGIILASAVVAYSIQIYADFSGYMDIVSGISEMFGINVSKNFNHPYLSRTMPEFWRRWHISLQEWFKDYIYYPIVTYSFIKKVRKKLCAKNMERLAQVFVSCFPILIVWLISGIWHGVAWKYVVWGLFHSMLLILSEVCKPIVNKITQTINLNTNNIIWHVIQVLRTFSLCCIGRVFFRAENVKVAFQILLKMVTQFNFSELSIVQSYGIDTANMVVLVLSILVLIIVDIIQEKISIRRTLEKQNIVLRWFIIYAGIFAVIIFGVYGPEYVASDFIYQQF